MSDDKSKLFSVGGRSKLKIDETKCLNEFDNVSTAYQARDLLYKFPDFQGIFRNMEEEKKKKILSESINNYRTTLLHFSVSLNKKKAVKELLEAGANVNVRDDLGLTPLHLASTVHIAQLLVDNGADINAKDNSGNSVLTAAINMCNPDVFDFLIKQKADSQFEKKRFSLLPNCTDKELIKAVNEFWYCKDL